ncbi:lipopolysaccharide biosynthesis protein [Sporosarcina sp. 6E9]|uniref:lipopolysaccharide biosynthesis protein n=1 Tax=Sporosarcina sp. 6E9 TaxID=2819235 RepID=UPI001B306F27|nr:oligosaccharide flippase family protein [Sporosarcina sp. 6E9]
MGSLFQKESITNTIYITLSQLISLVLSILLTFILPLIISIENFGYWQIYILYVTYVGILTLGFNDGIYLKYGHLNIDQLPFKLIRTSMLIYLLVLIIETLIFITLIILFESNEKLFIFYMVGINIIIMGLNGTFSMILLTTNQMKKYSLTIIVNRVLLFFPVIILLLFKFDNYKIIIYGDIFAKIVVCIISAIFLKDIIKGSYKVTKKSIKEYLNNISVGFYLLLANLSGMLILGVGRILVERFSTIEQYSIYSFGISVANIILVFISSLSLVLYPTLKRLPNENLGKYFDQVNIILRILIFSSFFLYFFVDIFIVKLLPNYVQIFTYLPYLFLIISFQSKIQLLNNTFYKALREEKSMFKANIYSLILFISIAVPVFYFTESIILLVFITLIINLLRSYSSEYYLSKKLNVFRFKNFFWEIIYMTTFLVSTLLFSKNIAITIMFIVYMIFIYYNKKVFRQISKKITGKMVKN